MSNNYGVRCATCREQCDHLRIAKGDKIIGEMIVLTQAIRATPAIMALAEGLTVDLDDYRVPLLWLLRHAEHTLEPVSEYDRRYDDDKYTG